MRSTEVHKSIKVIVFAVLLVGLVRKVPLISNTIPGARQFKEALGYNEDSYLNFTELVTKYGYKTEEHNVLTKDGYILTVFRIPPKCNHTERLYPVLLMHGLFDTSDLWIIVGPDLGLAYILSSNCYDVWAANQRGNVYSKRHKTLDPDKDDKYWDYSFDEHGNYDVPALIDYVIKVTEKPKVYYVGHSQGTTNFFVMSSLRPDYNQKVQLSIHLAPVTWMANIKNPIIKFLAWNAHKIIYIADMLGNKELLVKHHAIQFSFDILCSFLPEIFCDYGLNILTGHEIGSIKKAVLSTGFGHFYSGATSKELAHYAQLVKTNKFERFDEGAEGNTKKYHTLEPPEYNVSEVYSPVVLMTAMNDAISCLDDVDILSKRLSNLIENYLIPIKEWSHHNYLWDEKASNIIVPKILEYFQRYNV